MEDAREIELRLRIKQMILSGLISFIWIWVPTAVLLVSFWSLTSLFGRPLTVSIAFTSISLFAQLQGALRALPGQITSWLKGTTSSVISLSLSLRPALLGGRNPVGSVSVTALL